MADNDTKYTNNRNLWRKVIGYGAAKPRPVVESFVDPLTAITYSLNLQETFRHRDIFQVAKPFIEIVISSGGTGLTGEYDEGIIDFLLTDDVYKSINFGFEFTSSPIVVLTVDQNDSNTTNVMPYGITFSTTGAYVGVSAPFTGSLRYRALYAPSYPAYFTSSFTGSVITGSGGSVTVSTDSTEYSTTYTTLPAVPSEVYQTAWDSTTNTSDIYISGTTVTATEITSSLSAPYSKDIHFIVIV